MLQQILVVLGVDILCAIIAVIGFRFFSDAFKILSVLAILTALSETIGLVLIKYHFQNRFIFVIYALLSFILMCFYCYLDDDKEKAYLYPIPILAIIWVIEVAIRGINQVPQVFFTLHSLVIIGSYFILLYRKSFNTTGKIIKQPFFYIALGTIIFFGCYTHFHIIVNMYANRLTPAESGVLRIFQRTSANVKGILLTIGFSLHFVQSKKKLSS